MKKDYYIAYIDVLGTKNSAENYNYEKYLGLILNFQNELLSIAKKYSNSTGRIHFFSDCAYIESNNLADLINALKKLRDQLFDCNLFLKGSIVRGKLGAIGNFKTKEEFINYYNYDQNDKEVHDAIRCVFGQQKNDKLNGSLFFSTDLVKAYTNENNLKGAAIFVDEELVKEGKINDLIVESGYISNKDTFSSFYDIKYDNDKITDSFLDKVLSHYTKSNMQNKNYGRHYLSILISCINSTNIDSSIDEDFDNAPSILKKMLNLKNNHKQIYNYAIGLDYLYLTLVNKFYLDIGESSKLTKNFSKTIVNKNRKFLGKYLNNLSSISKDLLKKESRNLFIADMEEIQDSVAN
jgi:hypothetical protein